MSQNTFGILYGLLAFFLFIIGDAFYRHLGLTYSIIQIAFYVKLFGVITMVFYMLIRKQGLKTYFPKLQFYRSVAMTITTFSVIYAYKTLNLVEVTLLFYTLPFLIAFLTKFYLKENVGIHRIIGIILGFAGLLIIIRPGYIDFNPAHFILLFGIACLSFANILTRKMGESEPSINFALFPTLMTTICAVPLLVTQPILLPAAMDIPLFATAGILSALSFLLIAMAYIRTHAITVSILGYTEIIWAIIIDYVFFGEITNDPHTIIGGSIIILSGIYTIYRENRHKVKE